MGMEDPKPPFAYFVSQAKERFPALDYLRAIEPRVAGIDDRESSDDDSSKFLREIWGDKVFISAGGYIPETADETVKAKGGLIAFGRHHTTNVRHSLPVVYVN